MKTLVLIAFAGIPLFVGAPAMASSPDAHEAPDNAATLRIWVEEMKKSPRGPFERIRWFCADGEVLPPKPYACEAHGGGVQHGERNDRAEALRAQGFRVANVLAELDPVEFVGPAADLEGLKQILIERFLIAADDGWIFRGARTYRGALQIEDEEAGSERLVLALLDDPAWRRPERFSLLRETVRLLPLQGDDVSAAEVRQQALVLAAKDGDFNPLRAKIHSQPEPADAGAVRQYAGSEGKAELAAEYEELAAAIDALYVSVGAADALDELAKGDGDLAAWARSGVAALHGAAGSGARIGVMARLMAELRVRFATTQPARRAQALLRASLALENDVYVSAAKIRAAPGGLARRRLLELLGDGASALYGAGLISRLQLDEVRGCLTRLTEVSPLTVHVYRSELVFLGRVPEWASGWLEFNFSSAVAHLRAIAPLTVLFTQDRLRGSPLLLYSELLDDLTLDANHLAGIEHELFGEKIGAGLRGLNPGLARGVLLTADGGEAEVRSDGIYLLPETVSDLPRVAGILTRGEGSSLSHVQLLARNLGIPNVVVRADLLPRVEARQGKKIAVAVSPSGVVQIDADGPRWDEIFGASKGMGDVIIRPDLEKLDLSVVDLISLSELRATDSGRVSGPKGAKLGELKHSFGDVVPNGFVIPFGVFRQLLEQQLEPEGITIFEWMKQRYAAIAAAEGTPREAELVASFLARLRKLIATAELDAKFQDGLRVALNEHFGADGTYGVFVRSDTNVEDLPGFTGAGLNLTVPNVVGYDNVLAAVREVWASPFTERAYGWRQSHMENPEYVFPAVVVQLAFPAEKSGVMVTADVDTGARGWLSVAVSEGVGGAVDGQAAESLLIDARTGEARQLARATAPSRAALAGEGGIDRVPASGAAQVLADGEIDQLVRFAAQVPEKFPELRSADGKENPADVEFAFADGKLALLQIRPLVESRSAQRDQYLVGLDAGLRERGSARVDLNGVPRTSDH